jgi:acyl dehydratase
MSNAFSRYDESFFSRTQEGGMTTLRGQNYAITPDVIRAYYDAVEASGAMKLGGAASLIIGGAMLSQAHAVLGLSHDTLFGGSARIPVYVHQDLALQPGQALHVGGVYQPVLQIQGYDPTGQFVDLQTSVHNGKKVVATGNGKLFLPEAGAGVKTGRVTKRTTRGTLDREWEVTGRERVLEQWHIARFAETGDDNVLHVGVNGDPKAAVLQGSYFGETVSHGMNALGRAVAAAALLGYDDVELQRFSADFILPLYPGYAVQACLAHADHQGGKGRASLEYAVYERTHNNALLKGTLGFAE